MTIHYEFDTTDFMSVELQLQPGSGYRSCLAHLRLSARGTSMVYQVDFRATDNRKCVQPRGLGL